MHYNDIVLKYIDYAEDLMKKNNIDFTVFEFKELLRVSLCYGLNLPYTVGITIDNKYIKECSKVILKGIKTSNWTIDHRMGVLEACLKALVLAIANAEREELNDVGLFL